MRDAEGMYNLGVKWEFVFEKNDEALKRDIARNN